MTTPLMILIALPLVAAAPPPTPECRIAIVRPVADDGGRRWPAGAVVPASFIRRDGDRIFYCADHGRCVPQTVRGAMATRPVDCRPGRTTSPGYVALDPDPVVMGAAPARRMLARRRAEEGLSALGFSNAGAGSLAEAYARAPSSSTGRRVARALAGSSAALADLRRTQP